MKLTQFIQDFSSVIMLVILASNIVFIYIIKNTQQPQVVYQVTQKTDLDTSSIRSIVLEILQNENLLTSLNNGQSVQSVSFPYDYLIHQGRRAVKSLGRYYSEGSPTSYGVIKDIYPDRILLVNGIVLVNSKPYQESSVSSSPLIKEPPSE